MPKEGARSIDLSGLGRTQLHVRLLESKKKSKMAEMGCMLGLLRLRAAAYCCGRAADLYARHASRIGPDG